MNDTWSLTLTLTSDLNPGLWHRPWPLTLTLTFDLDPELILKLTRSLKMSCWPYIFTSLLYTGMNDPWPWPLTSTWTLTLTLTSDLDPQTILSYQNVMFTPYFHIITLDVYALLHITMITQFWMALNDPWPWPWPLTSTWTLTLTLTSPRAFECTRLSDLHPPPVNNDHSLKPEKWVALMSQRSLQQISGHSGFMGYGDLWGFISQTLFIINPCLDLWGFMKSLRVI